MVRRRQPDNFSRQLGRSNRGLGSRDRGNFGRGLGHPPALVLAWAVLLAIPTVISAEIITLNNGMQLRGTLRKIPSVNENPLEVFNTPNSDISKIVVVDDDLRRVYVSSNNVRTDGLAAEGILNHEKIVIPKRTAAGASRKVTSVGPILRVTPFDEFGNRTFTMQGPRGPVDVIQGITLVTPTFTKVEGLMVDNPLQWDMREATSSISRELLSRIVMRSLKHDDPHDRLRLVTLYMQSKRYRDALVELEATMAQFPDLRDLENQRKRLYQLVAEDVIREIELRRDAGQHTYAYHLLKNFPSENIAGEILLKVGDILQQYETFLDQRVQVGDLLDKHIEQLTEGGGDDNAQHRLARTAADEIKLELNINNIARLADYLRLSDDEMLKTDQKISLAVSGWLLGSGAGIQNLAESLSLLQVRDAVRDYLRTPSNQQLDRENILARLTELEGSSPQYVARLIAHMKPPLETDFPEEGPPGLLSLQVDLPGDEQAEYWVQLPPEYDPYRRYPCVVTLHAAGVTPQQQINWWAGDQVPSAQGRAGQSTRHGYIVIAPAWTKGRQRKYEYSFREHAVTLNSLRDACKRFSIDTDRVFLSGHSAGGDAAWDMGLAHPDLWAGVLPVVARANKYVSLYWENGRQLPMYFVGGAMDGSSLADNSRDLDRYMKYAGFDATLVTYIGRGHEHYQDEIQYMFDWMQRYRRTGMPQEFKCVSNRPWDRFFWWVELDDFPDRAMVLPELWPKSKLTHTPTESKILPSNGILVKSPAAQATIWLSPDFVDFDQRITINGKRMEIVPTTLDLLEDVRSRGDRQHPFWARHQVQLGRRR